MRLLLDTNALLWLMDNDPRLDRGGRAFMLSASEIYVSSASMWEIAIKSSLGKMKANPEELVAAMQVQGLLELPVCMRHTITAAKLPLLHRDPFARLLVAQAITEPMRLLTSDAQLSAYSELVIQM